MDVLDRLEEQLVAAAGRPPRRSRPPGRVLAPAAVVLAALAVGGVVVATGSDDGPAVRSGASGATGATGDHIRRVIVQAEPLGHVGAASGPGPTVRVLDAGGGRAAALQVTTVLRALGYATLPPRDADLGRTPGGGAAKLLLPVSQLQATPSGLRDAGLLATLIDPQRHREVGTLARRLRQDAGGAPVVVLLGRAPVLPTDPRHLVLTGDGDARGVARSTQVGPRTGFTVAATGLHRSNHYAVWSGGPGAWHLFGFAQQDARTHRLSGAAVILDDPGAVAGATIVTRETTSTPTQPGPIVLDSRR